MKNQMPAYLAQTFLVEAGDLLTQVESIILELKPGEADLEAINRLFRAFHTIKGSGAMFGFDAVSRFTHHLESALDQVRAGVVALTPRMAELILASKDEIATMLENRDQEQAVPSERSKAIIEALGALVGSVVDKAPVAKTGGAASLVSRSEAVAVADRQPWRIHFRPPLNIAANGQDPLALLDSLRALGPCEVRACMDAVPPLGSLNPEQCHVSWEIALESEAGLNAIRDIFIFVEDESELSIEPGRPVAEAAAATGSLPQVSGGDVPVTRQEPDLTEIVPAPERTPVRIRSATGKDSSVRVPSERLDRLVNLVGELVMNQSRLSQVSARSADPDLAVTVEDLERLIAELRDNVLGIRMMPIGTTFNRFKRLVHDLSGELHKEIELITEGAETELDKTVLDQLGDPLVHLIRNSIDHGIEAPEERERLGKKRCGVIRLTANHVGSSVVITIVDDGRGLDEAAIRAKAIEKRLISPDTQLTQKEIFNLILLPGFSTARTVTSLSGRGVGMDVVKKEIDALRGTIQICSEAGRGTKISATLPLTLAIIDGLLVEVDGDKFIIPMSAVLENVELTRAERGRNNGRNVIAVRGELVPYARLRDTFNSADEGQDIEKVVIVRHGGERVGLVVDRVIGSHQTVIQSLGRFYRGIELLSGATIMGDGRVALIIDVAGLVHFLEKRDGARTGPGRSPLAASLAA
jgi:two-component system chemotaxis sensor kinase CheA